MNLGDKNSSPFLTVGDVNYIPKLQTIDTAVNKLIDEIVAAQNGETTLNAYLTLLVAGATDLTTPGPIGGTTPNTIDSSSLQVSANTPLLNLYHNVGASGEKYVRFINYGSSFGMELVNDAYSAAKSIFNVARSGYAASTISLGNSSDSPNFNFLGTGALTAGGTIQATGSIVSLSTSGFISQSTQPSFISYETDVGADAKRVRIFQSGGVFAMDLVNDAFTLSNPFLAVTRSGYNVATINFGNATNNPTYDFLGTGVLGLGGGIIVAGNIITNTGVVSINGVSPSIHMYESSAGADAKYTRIYQSGGGSLAFDLVNDAFSAAKAYLQVTRSGYAVAAMNFGNASDNPAYSFLGSGVLTVGGSIIAPTVTITSLGVFSGSNFRFNDSAALHLGTGDDFRAYFDASNTIFNMVAGDLYIQDNGTSKFAFIGASGDFHADGELISFSTTVGSDMNLKTNFSVIQDAAYKLSLFEGAEFDWIGSGRHDSGIGAQQVREVLPWAVSEVDNISTEGTRLNVNYNAVTGLLVAAVNEHTSTLQSHEDRLQELEAA